MNETTIGIIALLMLLGLFLTGLELAFAMGIIGVVGFAWVVNVKAAMGLMANDFFDSLANYGFTVIPLFVLMGQIAFNAGIAKRLFDCAHKFVGHIPGGLAIATVAGATAFKAICGSVAATSATFASVAVPEMTKFGYAKKLSTGIVATVGTLGVLIPPSVTLIIFGIVTQQSIGKLFLAGLVPGLLIAFFFAIIIFGWCRVNPELGPSSEKFSWGERVKTLPDIVWPIIIFFVIIIGLMKGVFTPTEAGSIGAFAVLVLCLLKRNINFSGYVRSVQESLRTACMVLLLIATSTMLGHFIAVTNIPGNLGEWVLGLKVAPMVIMTLVFFVYLIGGSFIDDLAFMILATPIFFPYYAETWLRPATDRNNGGAYRMYRIGDPSSCNLCFCCQEHH
ncbi:MAG TPA: TRAP transporter large permease [Syntrophorhabdaceae bacterium]|nr:TRAP transporter large permease [Syntrophorhabdaceae bacterium]